MRGRKVTQEYSAATNDNRNEAVLDLNLAMADTKTEMMIMTSKSTMIPAPSGSREAE